MTLGYTVDDDGVHLFCSCGEDINLGFGPSPADAVAVQVTHLRVVAAERRE